MEFSAHPAKAKEGGPERNPDPAGNFQGKKKKLSQIGEKYDFRGENFCGLLAYATPKDTTPPNFTEKTFANSHKTAKFMKVFSLKSFPLYGTIVW